MSADTLPPAPIEPTSRDGRVISGGRQWYMVVALLLVTVVAGVDRNVLNLLGQDVKRDLAINDGQLGLLLGLSFAVFYALTSLPMGWLVDRVNRKALMLGGALTWSLSTMACGLSSSFGQLFAGRVGVGFSEGGLHPMNFSLVRDGVRPDRHGRALAIISMAGGMGGALSFLFGGIIYAIARKHVPISAPMIGALEPWQVVLIATGAIGLPSLLLLLPVREPARKIAAAQAMSYVQVLRFMQGRWQVFAALMLFSALVSMSTAPYVSWVAPLLQRNFDMTIPQVAKVMVPLLLIPPIVGYFASGVLIDMLVKAGRRNSIIVQGLAGALAAGVLGVLAPLSPDLSTFRLSMALLLVLSSISFPVQQTVLARIAPRAGTGKAVAIFGIITGLIGQSLSAWLVGHLSDTVFKAYGVRSLNHAISAVELVLTLALIPAGLWLHAALKAHRDTEEA